MGKIVTVQQLEDIIESLPHDDKAVQGDDIVNTLRQKLGDGWSLTKTPPVKFTRDDINAVANSRFYRKSGLKLLMIATIVALGVYILMGVFPNVPIGIWYSAWGLGIVYFMFVYARKQRQARKELWKGIKGDGINGGE
jgi:hypothetical protein